jgi:hypothetical protein
LLLQAAKNPAKQFYEGFRGEAALAEKRERFRRRPEACKHENTAHGKRMGRMQLTSIEPNGTYLHLSLFARTQLWCSWLLTRYECIRTKAKIFAISIFSICLDENVHLVFDICKWSKFSNGTS